MKLFLLLLFLNIDLSAKSVKEVQYIYYKDPMSVHTDIYYKKDCYEKCKDGYDHGGDFNPYGRVKCWCSKYRVIKARVIDRAYNKYGNFYYVVTVDGKRKFEVYHVDIIKIETKREK